MKKYIVGFILLLCSFSLYVSAQNYHPVAEGSAVRFAIVNHMIFKSTVNGSFTGLKGTITFDPKNPALAAFDVSVPTKTISTGIGMRDDHLLEKSYFYEEKYPNINIKSKSIAKAANGQYILNAALTIKGVTKNISFPFTAVLTDEGYEFKGRFEINRMDFTVGPDNSIEKKVNIELAVMAK